MACRAQSAAGAPTSCSSASALGQLADARPRTLSGGERQRVALARALAPAPRALLLDEPLSALDARTRASASRELAAVLREAAVPALLVTHDFAEAAVLGDRVAIVDGGRIVQEGPRGELAAKPASAFVADFTGAVVLTGVARTGAEEGLTVVDLDGGGVVASTDRESGPVAASVFPWEIELEALGSEHGGSARNRLRAEVVSVTAIGNRVRVGLLAAAAAHGRGHRRRGREARARPGRRGRRVVQGDGDAPGPALRCRRHDILARVRRAPPLTLLTATLLALAACGFGGDDDNVAGAQAGGVRLVGLGSFEAPLYVTAPRGDRRRVFVVEQGGTVRVIRAGRRLSRPFLDIRGRVMAGGEQGLLSIAFAPDYASSRRFYVNHTDRQGVQRVVEYRRSRSSADRADASSARLVLRYDDEEANHNGGLLVFGPDRLLYIGTGDGGGANDQHGARGNAQDLGSLLGKLLRIDPRRSGSRRYRVPSSNPFVGRAGARPEIYSYGLRNPWRFSFDRSTGDLAIGDVGQNAVEEIDFTRRGQARGANFGWRPFEGRSRITQEPAPGHVPPVLQLGHDAGYCSITGGYVVRDPALRALAGRYVYGDFCAASCAPRGWAPGAPPGIAGSAFRRSSPCPPSARTRAAGST